MFYELKIKKGWLFIGTDRSFPRDQQMSFAKASA